MRYEALGYRKINGLKAVSIGLTPERYEEVRAAKATCLFAVDLEEKLALVLDNFFEFEVDLLRLAQTWLLWSERNLADAMLERLTLDRRIVNLLTACRLYLDQTDHGISRLFGNPSEELKSIKALKNALYDEHWGYRLMEALRNHVQHSGLPVHAIMYNEGCVTGQRSDFWQITITPQAFVKTLAENETFKKSVLTELESKGDRVDLRGPTREYVSCLIALHQKVRETIQARATTARQLYEMAVREFSEHEGKPVELTQLYALDRLPK